MGGCYAPINQKQTKDLARKKDHPQKESPNLPNPEVEQDLQPQKQKPCFIIVKQNEQKLPQLQIAKSAIRESCYYSKIDKHIKEQLNVCEPSQVALSMIQRLQIQDPDSAFFKGIPRNIDKSTRHSRMSKKQETKKNTYIKLSGYVYKFTTKMINLQATYCQSLIDIIQIGWTELANINFKLHSRIHYLTIMNLFQGMLQGPNVTNVRPGGSRSIQFFRELRVYPASFAFREDIEKGDKILLPSSALNELYPLLNSKNKDPLIFCLKNGSRMTYCGVLQFVAEEGLCYIPNWMFKMLKFLQPGSPATLALVPDLQRKYGHVRHMIKLQPHQTKFIELNNPKAVLEYQLRNFTCLHADDTITIEVFGEKFEIDILEIKPENEYKAICIIDADVDVDFAPPLDYVEPTTLKRQASLTEETTKKKKDVFSGEGMRIDQKAGGNRKASQNIPPSEQEQYDPRKHRIHRGVRKTSIEWAGKGMKISDPVGVRKR